VTDPADSTRFLERVSIFLILHFYSDSECQQRYCIPEPRNIYSIEYEPNQTAKKNFVKTIKVKVGPFYIVTYC